MRPIALGLILIMLGGYFWMLLILIFGTSNVVEGIIGLMILFSLIITAAIEIYQWLKRRKLK